MSLLSRRHFLGALAALVSCGLSLANLPRGRVVIVGGGWGGLAAARRLRQLAPELDVVLVDRGSGFCSLPLSNKWLVDRTPDDLVRQDYGVTARAWGYQALQAEVSAIDREQRRVLTSRGTLNYDWLILAAGIRHDYRPWFGEDGVAAELARSTYPSGFMAAELPALKRKLMAFQGGDLLMSIPPPPYRCPPAPYERAVMIAWFLKTRGIKGRLVLVDGGGGMPRFNRLFAERYKEQILHFTHTPVKSVDLARKAIVTEYDDIAFDDAMLIPPQQAADLLWQAGLVETAGESRGWGVVDPLHLNVPGDERVFLIGDALGRVSPLFGAYPKTAHMATRLGQIAAGEIASRSRGQIPPLQLPETICHVYTDLEPMEMLRIDAQYRLRGDGLISQSLRQYDEPQPRGEDVQWARALSGEFLAPFP